MVQHQSLMKTRETSLNGTNFKLTPPSLLPGIPPVQTNWATYARGIGTNPNNGKHVKGTNTLFSIHYNMITANRCKKITYSKVVCKVQPEKGDNADCTRITIGGDNIVYPEDVGTPTGLIELVNLLI
jgi:hypothetical protein